jgi:transposase-like protein
MRYPASDKLEIIRIIEQSHLPVRRTLEKLGILLGSFYRWYDRYQTGGVEARRQIIEAVARLEPHSRRYTLKHHRSRARLHGHEPARAGSEVHGYAESRPKQAQHGELVRDWCAEIADFGRSVGQGWGSLRCYYCSTSVSGQEPLNAPTVLRSQAPRTFAMVRNRPSPRSRDGLMLAICRTCQTQPIVGRKMACSGIECSRERLVAL